MEKRKERINVCYTKLVNRLLNSPEKRFETEIETLLEFES